MFRLGDTVASTSWNARRDRLKCGRRGETRRRLSCESLEDRRVLAAPTTISLTPSVATVATGTSIDLVGRFADADGSSNLRLAEFRVANGYTNAPHCRVRFYQTTNDLRLYDGTAREWLNAGSPGSGGTVATSDCALDAELSTVNQVNSTTIDVSVNLSFTSGLEGQRNVWLRAFDQQRTWSSKDDRGDLTVVAGVNPPTGLGAVGGNQQVALDWNDSSDPNVSGYRVYQSTTAGGPYTPVNSSLLTTSDFIVTGLANNTAYSFVVTADDGAGGESPYSNEATATPTSGPVAPTTVFVNPSDAIAATDVPIQITGRYADANGVDDLRVSELRVSTGYSNAPHCRLRYYENTDTLRLYDASVGKWISAGSPGGGTTVANAHCSLDASASSTSIVDSTTREVSFNVAFKSGLEGTRNLWLRALDYQSNWSSKDDQGNVTISPGSASPPAAPTGLSATAGDGNVILDWADNVEPNLTGYDVHRSLSSGGPFSPVNGVLLANSNYLDTGLSNGTTYYYVVTAANTVPLNSSYSTQVSATPMGGPSGPVAPTTISVNPSLATIPTGTPTVLTGRFADGNGTDDLVLTEFRVSTGYSNAPYCRVRYYHTTNTVRLYDGAAGIWRSAGQPGSAGTASTSNCSLDASGSSVTPINATTLEVKIEVAFDETLEGERNVWLRAYDSASTWSSADDRGDLAIVEQNMNGLPLVLIDGYTDAQSYDQGDTQQVFINAHPLEGAQIDLYDVLGNVVDSVVFDAEPQSMQGTRPWVDGFGYSPSFSYNIGSLPSGLYFWDYEIPFVVKDTAKSSEIRVVMPTNTMNAYNCAGGRSLYNNKCGGEPKETVVTFERPHSMTSYTTNSGATIPRDRAWGTPFFWWLQQEIGSLGASYGALADSDLDDPSALAGAEVLVLPGHSEYWTRAARETVDAFVAAGGDVAVMSGNTMWWQSRYQDNNKDLVVYKSFADPIGDPLLETVLWDEPSLQYPTTDSVGANFTLGGYSNSNPPGNAPASWLGYKIVAEDSPLLEGTNLQNGDILQLDFDGTEYDGAPLSGFDGNGFPVIDNSVLGFHQVELIGFDHGYRFGPTIGTMFAFQKTPTSGIVVNTATLHWAYAMTTSSSASDLQTVSYNILEKMLNDDPIFSSTPPSPARIDPSWLVGGDLDVRNINRATEESSTILNVLWDNAQQDDEPTRQLEEAASTVNWSGVGVGFGFSLTRQRLDGRRAFVTAETAAIGMDADREVDEFFANYSGTEDNQAREPRLSPDSVTRRSLGAAWLV